MQVLLLLMVDALRHDYIDPSTTPFLSELAKRHGQWQLVPPFGFEPDDALFAGLPPETSDSGAQFWLDPVRSPFRFVPVPVGGIADRLPAPIRMALRAALMMMVKIVHRGGRVRDHPTTARIPFRFLRYFDFVKRQYPFEPGYAGGRSLFDLARQRGITWSFHGFPRDDVRGEMVALAARQIDPAAGSGLYYYHIGDLDAAGHRWGPHSVRLREALRRLDEQIERIVDAFHSRFDGVQVLIFGDHGMCEVTRLVDVESVLARTKLRAGRDYLYFLDSTLARFWPRRPGADVVLREALGALGGLRLLGAQERATLEMRYEHDRFGNLIYQLDEGCVIHPSFYADRKAPRGMHGYGPEAIGDHAALIADPGDLAETVAASGGPADRTLPMASVYDMAVAALARIV